MRTASTDEDLSGPNPNWAKFGYSQKEVWNWLYTDNDINQNRRIISTGRTYKFIIKYRISAKCFRGNYSRAETIRGNTVFKEEKRQA